MLIFLYGKTGAGKDYIARYLQKNYQFDQLKRPTTRPQRSEREKSYYEFLSEEDFEERVLSGFIPVHYGFRGWRYGVFRNLGIGNKVLTGDKTTAFSVKTMAEEQGIKIVLVEVVADEAVRIKRISGREKKPDLKEMARRMKSDDIDYENHSGIPDKILDNSFGTENIDKIMKEIIYG